MRETKGGGGWYLVLHPYIREARVSFRIHHFTDRWYSSCSRNDHNDKYEGVSKSFRTESITKYILTKKKRWEATQRVMAAKLTRLTLKIAIQLHLVAEIRTTCSSRSRRPVRKLLDTALYMARNWYSTAAREILSLWTQKGSINVLTTQYPRQFKPACSIYSRSILMLSSHQHLDLPSVLFTSSFPSKFCKHISSSHSSHFFRFNRPYNIWSKWRLHNVNILITRVFLHYHTTFIQPNVCLFPRCPGFISFYRKFI
jgi:hypothetical protein